MKVGRDANGNKYTVAGAVGGGTSYSNDSFSNETYSAISQTYIVVQGQAKLETTTTKTYTHNSDGSESWMDGAMHSGKQSYALKLSYEYNQETGKLHSARASGVTATGALSGQSQTVNGVLYENMAVSVSNDGFENITETKIAQVFTVSDDTLGQGKMTRSVSVSDTTSIDTSTSHQELIVDYIYRNGVLESASGSGSIRSVDAFGTITKGTLDQIYQIINGQAKMTSQTTKTWSANSRDEATSSYSNPGTNWDGSSSKQEITVNYTYEERVGEGIKTGLLKTAKGGGTLLSDDGVGNISKGTIDQDYDLDAIVNLGKALLKSTKTVTESYHKEIESGSLSDGNVAYGGLDGSEGYQEMTVYYAYNDQGAMVEEGGVYGGNRERDGPGAYRTYGEGSFENKDEFGTISLGEISQTYFIINGQAKIASSVTDSTTTNLDTSIQKQSLTTYYSYDALGFLVEDTSKITDPARRADASKNRKIYGTTTHGFGNTFSDDGFGNQTVGFIVQEYQIGLKGKAQLHKNITYSVGKEMFDAVRESLFGTITSGDAPFYDETMGKIYRSKIENGILDLGFEGHSQTMTLTYEHDNGTIQNPGNGRLKSATGEGTFKSTDGFGSLTSGSIKQDYEIDKFYKALMVKSTTRSMTENGDGTTSWMGVDHAGKYHDGMSSSEILGEALVVDYIDEVGSRDFGYERGSDGKLTGEFISGEGKAARGRSVSLSKHVGDFSFTKTEMYQEYTVVNGQARMTLNTTKTYSVSVNADWKVSSNWVGSYEEPGSALDGSRNRQTINTRYTFETRKGRGISTGVLTAASGSGTGWSSDGLGSETWNLIRQNYDSVKIQQFGKALLTENITASYTKNFDGSESWTGNVSPILVAQLEAAQKEYEGAQKELSAVAGAIGSSAAVSPAASGEITSGAPVVPSVSGDLLKIQGRMLKIKSKIDGIQAKIDFFSARSSRTEAMTVRSEEHTSE